MIDYLPHDAYGLTLFREISRVKGRSYTTCAFTNGRSGVCHWLRKFSATGLISGIENLDNAYGVLDILNREGDIVYNYAIPSSSAFQQIKRSLRLKVATHIEEIGDEQ